MDQNVKTSWEKILHPATLRKNIIVASIFIMVFEMLKESIVEKIKDFYMVGFDENDYIMSEKYQQDVLSLHPKRRPLGCSLLWLKNSEAIDDKDLETFERINDCRNILTHETLKYLSQGVDFNIEAVFLEMFALLKKIEIWWFQNLELSVNPENYPEDINIEEVLPGPIWTIQMLIDIALGPEDEATKYYEHFVASSKNL